MADRLFELHRAEDVSGVSGIGVVASGVEFADGTVAIRWRGEHSSTVLWPSIEDAIAVHGHDGRTQIHYVDCTGFEGQFAAHVEFFGRPPFSEGSVESFATKAATEAAEFAAEPSLEEAADVLICLIGWTCRSGLTAADLVGAVAKKLAVNESRTWTRQPDGTLQHVEGGADNA